MLAMALWMLTGWAAPALLPPVPPVALTASWTIVELPQVPLGIAEHDGKLWVCGANEMIAMSADGGSHWALLHEKNKGEMLFTFAFVGPDEIQAYGTRGLRLESMNDGRNWQSENAKGGAEFLSVTTDGKIGFAANTWQFGWTTDGGAKWKLESRPDPNDQHSPNRMRQLVDISGAAQLDVTHAAVFFADAVAATDDRGKTWRQTPFAAQWHWDALRIESGAYKLYGYYQASKGAAHQAAEGISTDGLQWRLTDNAPVEYNTCNSQGCLVATGWVDLRGMIPHLYSLPDAPGNVQSWAVSGATMCQVAGEPRCRTGLESMSALPPAIVDCDSINPQPIKTPEANYDDNERRLHESGNARVSLIIGKDGTVSDIALVDATTPDFAAEAIKAVSKWTFHPGTKAGAPVAVVAAVDISFRLY